MSVFSRLFGGARKRLTETRPEEIKQALEEIAKQTNEQMQAVDELSRAIVKAAVLARDAVKHLAIGETLDDDSRLAKEMAVFYQCIYFVRRIAMLAARHCLEASKLDRLLDLLDPLLASTAISSYFRHVTSEHFPQSVRDGLIRDYYECAHSAEREFMECARLCSEKQGGDRMAEIMLALHQQTAKNISLILSESNEHYTSVFVLTTPAFTTASEILPAVERLAKVDLPHVNANDFLRHLMTST